MLLINYIYRVETKNIVMRTSYYSRITLIISILMLTQSCNDRQNIEGVLIKNVTAIDAKNGMQEQTTILIEENKITKIGSTEDFKDIEVSNTIDGTGKFLIPGLWDTHIHMVYDQDLTPAMFDLFLLYGITSVRDTGGEIDLLTPLKQEADNDTKNTPRLKIAGPLLDGVPTVYNGEGRLPKLGVSVPTISAAREQVLTLQKAGVDILKVYEMLPPEIFTTILKLADSLELPVTGHVPLSMDATEAANLGMRSMEHLRNLEFAFVKNWDSLKISRRTMLENQEQLSGMKLRSNIHDAQRSFAFANEDAERKKEVLAALKHNQTWQVPTLTIITVAAERFFDTPEWKETFNLIPDTVGSGWASRLEKYAATTVSPKFREYADWMFKTIAELKAADVKLMAGTDTPIFFLTPGYSLHEELALLVKGGLTPMEALDAATLQPAKYFNMENELGSIEPGMLADLILLEANPLENIRNTTTIQAVIRDGKVHDKNALDQLKKKLENL